MTTPESLREQTAKDLAQMAKKHGVSGWHSMRKEQLIRALLRVSRNGKSSGSNKKNSPQGRANTGSKATRRRTSDAATIRARAASRTKRSTAVANRLQEMKSRRAERKNLASRGKPKKDRLVAIVRDAYWLHAYWELQRRSVERAAAALGQYWYTAKPVLRLSRVTVDGVTQGAETVIRDIPIHGGLNNWYIHVDDPPSSYRLAIGYLAEDQRFYTMARSQVVTTPSPDASDAIDENWDAVAQDCEKIYALSGGNEEVGSYGELKELFEERLRRPMGSPMVTRYGVGADPSLGEARDFRLEVDAELIVYGTTDPEAHVMLRGEPVSVRPDGTFTVRMSMPDRRQVIPVVASTSDGLEQRTIVLAVERNTKVMETVIREPEEPQA